MAIRIDATDHDLLIKLVETQKLNHAAVLEKVNGVDITVREVRDGNTLQLAKMDARIIVLETFKQTRLIDEKITDWNTAADWVKTYRSRWKWIAGLIGISAGVIGYLLNTILPLIKH